MTYWFGGWIDTIQSTPLLLYNNTCRWVGNQILHNNTNNKIKIKKSIFNSIWDHHRWLALEPPADWPQRPNTTVQSPSHCTLTGFRDQSAAAARSGVGPADEPAVNDLPFWEWRWAEFTDGLWMDFHYYSKKKEDDLDFFRLDRRSVLLCHGVQRQKRNVHRISLLQQWQKQ